MNGYVCTPDAFRVHGASCPDLPRDALRDAERESLELWTRGSITTVRIGLVAASAVFTAGLIGAVGSIVAGRPFTSTSRARKPKDIE